MFQTQIYQYQEEVQDIVYDAMDLFWNEQLLPGMHARYFAQHPQTSHFHLVEKMFAMAALLAPYRLDLKYSVGFMMICQGKLEEALAVYREITRCYGSALSAKILEAVYSKVLKGSEQYELLMQEAASINSFKIQIIREAVTKAEIGLRRSSFEHEPFPIASGDLHYIVILGFALNEDGSMKPALLKRLAKGLEMYRMNQNSKFVLSGGYPKAGRTESFMMMDWLLQQGVPLAHITLEEKSKDTLSNAVEVIPKLQAAGAQIVTLVTSATHMRRASLLFEAISEQRGFKAEFHYLTDSNENISEVSTGEELAVLRDVVRAWGIWALPGLLK